MAAPSASAGVARLVGVSQSAVPRVLAHGASASPDTVDEPVRAAEMPGCRLNVLAPTSVPEFQP